MAVQTIEKGKVYSGDQLSGYNPRATYNRSYYLSEELENTEQIIGKLGIFIPDFESGRNTRFVYNTILDAESVGQIDLITKQHPQMQLEGLIRHNNGDNKGKYNVIFAYNKGSRAIDEQTRYQLQETIEGKASKYRNISTAQIIQNLSDVLQSGCHIWIPSSPGDIVRLRGDNFQRDLSKAIELINSKENIVMGLYDSGGHIVSLAMISNQGESTERATVPEHRGKGYIDALLTAMHNYAICKNPQISINAEARYKQSLGVALRAGFMSPEQHQGRIPILTNHVIIGNKNTEHLDAPDPGNEDRKGKPRYNRHFVPMGLREEMYDEETIRQIKNITNS